MNHIIDITRPIHPGMAIYPGNPEVTFEQVAQAGAGSSALTRITLGSHTGTHIDAPSHITAGAAGTGTYLLESMVGPAEVIAINPKAQGTNTKQNQKNKSTNTITAADLSKTSQSRVLIKTTNSSGDPDIFDPDFVALDESAAEELVRRGVVLVGIDGPSIKKKGVQDRVHAILLDANIVIVEGLWLPEVSPGFYELLCLPLAIDTDGSAARVLLVSDRQARNP